MALAWQPPGSLAPGVDIGWTTRNDAVNRPRPAGTGQRMWRSDVSATAGGHDGTATQNAGERLGLKTGMIVQELGWDEDVDDGLRAAQRFTNPRSAAP